MADSVPTNPRTPEELLDRTEAATRRRISRATLRFGDQLGEATGLRGPISRHPYLAVTAGLIAGFVVGPLLARHPKTSQAAAIGVASLNQMVKKSLEQYFGWYQR